VVLKILGFWSERPGAEKTSMAIGPKKVAAEEGNEDGNLQATQTARETKIKLSLVRLGKGREHRGLADRKTDNGGEIEHPRRAERDWPCEGEKSRNHGCQKMEKKSNPH